MKKYKVLTPDYYYKFQCTGNKCEDHCCKGWQINIDKQTYIKYKNIKNTQFKSKLKDSISRNRKSNSDFSYGNIKLARDGLCPLLSEDGLCEVYINLGPDSMSETCKVYPRYYNRVNDGLEFSLTLSCIEAARLILLNQDIMEFNLDLKQIGKVYINKSIDTFNNSNVNKKYFNELRSFCIGLMQKRQYSIEERLTILGIFFDYIEKEKNIEYKILQIIDKYDYDIEHGLFDGIIEKIRCEGIYDKQIQFLISSFRNLINNTYISNKRYINNLNKIAEGLNRESSNYNKNDYKEMLERYKKNIAKYEYIYENYLVNYMFSNLFPADCDSLTDSYLNMMVQFATIKINIIGIMEYYGCEFEEMHIVDTIQGFSISLVHDSNLVDKIYAYLLKNNINNIETIIMLTCM